MALANFQMAFNGLTIGDGTRYDIIQVDGLDSMPAVAMNDVARARDYGEYPGSYFTPGRDVIIDIEVNDTADLAFRADIDALGTYFATTPDKEMPLTWLLPGMTQVSRQVGARPDARAMVTDINYVYHKAKATLRFHATDPRIYDSTLQTLQTTLPIGTGGLVWPASWPVAWGASGGSGTMTVVNSGGFASPPVVTIAGPVDNPSIQNLTSGLSVTFALSLTNTDTLVVDFGQKTVLLNGTGNRRGTRTSDSVWWTLAAGTSTIGYRANTVQVGSTCTIAWRSAWM